MASEVQSQAVATLLRMVVRMRGPNGGGVAGILRMGAYPHSYGMWKSDIPSGAWSGAPIAQRFYTTFITHNFILIK